MRVTLRSVALSGVVALGLIAPALLSSPGYADESTPAVGDCLRAQDTWSPTSPIEVVECTEKHNSEVFQVAPYPSDVGPPSSLTENELYALGGTCSPRAFAAWLGAKVELPMRIVRAISVPTQAEWDAGSRYILCRTLLPNAKWEPRDYVGEIPELFSSTPVFSWLNCLTKAPKSGQSDSSPPVACTSKSKWLLLGGAKVKGKITDQYPNDLQSAADKACAPLVKKFGTKGATGLAALLAKEYVSPGSIWAECYVPVASWNGKVS